MADITQTTQTVEELTAATKELKNSAGVVDTLKNKAIGTTRATDKLGVSIRNLTKFFRPLGKETRVVNALLEQSSEAIATTTENMVELSMKGKKSALGMNVEIKRLTSGMMELAKQTDATSRKLDDQMMAYKQLAERVIDADKQIKQLDKDLKKGTISVEEHTAAVTKLKDTQTENRKMMGTQQEDIERTATLLRDQTKATIESHQSMVNGIRDMRAMNREARNLAGGLGSLTTGLEEMFDSKIFQWLDSKAWLILLGKAAAMANKAAMQTGQMYKINQQLARQFGTDAKTGFGAFVDAGKEAQKTMTSLTLTAGQLGMEMEELTAIADKIRLGEKLGVFAEKGADAEQTVRDLTKEVAYFSQITGVDADSAIAMLDRRMKTMGLSAQQARGDLASVSVMLKQMTLGGDKAKISMEDMTRMIESASLASDSYIVDTRLMTQSMRAAANQAAELGANQKLAKSTAESMGKIAAGTTGNDWIDTVSGNNLAEMLAKNPDEILKNLTGSQSKFVKSIQERLANKEIDQYQAGKLLNEQIGGTGAGMKARMDQIMKLADSPVAPLLMVQQGLAKDNSTALMMLDQFKKYKTDQARLSAALGPEGAGDIGPAEIMADRANQINKAISGLSSQDKQIEALTKDMGLTKDEAQRYLGLTADNPEQLWAKQTQFLAKALDPRQKSQSTMQMISQLRAQGKTDVEIKKAIQNQYAIAEDNVEGLDQIDAVLRKTGDAQQDELINLQNMQSALGNEQKEALDSFYNRLDKGVVGAILAELRKIAPGLLSGGPASQLAGAGVLAATAVGMKVMAPRLLSMMGKIPGFGGLARIGGGMGGGGAAIASGAAQNVGRFANLAKWGGRALPVVGGLATIAASEMSGASHTRSILRGIGSVAGGIGGGVLGSAAGPVGTFAGGVAGAYGGEKAGDWIADLIEGDPEEAANAAKDMVLQEQMANDIGSIARYFDEKKKDEIQGKASAFPAGGNFNQPDFFSTMADSTKQGLSTAGGSTAMKPSLQNPFNSGDGSMEMDANTFNQADDSVLVKFKGWGAFYAMMEKRKVALGQSTV